MSVSRAVSVSVSAIVSVFSVGATSPSVVHLDQIQTDQLLLSISTPHTSSLMHTCTCVCVQPPLAYSAPELVGVAQQPSGTMPASDVFSLGAHAEHLIYWHCRLTCECLELWSKTCTVATLQTAGLPTVNSAQQ